jgi:hypothetical protein
MDRMRQIAPERLLFAHYGPVSAVESALDRSESVLRQWVGMVREARALEMDLDHAVAMVRERTPITFAGEQTRAEREATWEFLSSTAANVAGISRWLDQAEGPGSTSGDAASVGR